MKLIMQNEPNFRKSQMFIILIMTTNYNEKLKLDTWLKQTQTNPIYGEQSRTILSRRSLLAKTDLFVLTNVRIRTSVFEPALRIVIGLQGRRNHIADGVIFSQILLRCCGDLLCQLPPVEQPL